MALQCADLDEMKKLTLLSFIYIASICAVNLVVRGFISFKDSNCHKMHIHKVCLSLKKTFKYIYLKVFSTLYEHDWFSLE